MTLAVVVLPSLPVTPRMGHGQTAKNASISLGDDRAVRLRLQQLRHVGPHPGRAEDDVRVQIAQITLAEVQHRAERLVVRGGAAERRALLPVAGDDLHTVPRQQLHERTDCSRRGR